MRPCTCNLDNCNPAPTTNNRVRLYRKGDEIADALLQKKLSREYLRLAHLKQFIFWTGIGRAGALHFKDQLRQKKMAEGLRESVANGLSVEKTQKMIRRHVLACIPACRLSVHATALSGPSTSKRKVTKGVHALRK